MVVGEEAVVEGGVDRVEEGVRLEEGANGHREVVGVENKMICILESSSAIVFFVFFLSDVP